MILLYAGVSKSQSTVVIPDTVKCYGRTDLQKIATKVTRAAECDSLLVKTEGQNKDLLVKLDNKNSEISKLNKESSLKDTVITGQKAQIDKDEKSIKRLDRVVKALKIGWVATTVVLGGLVGYQVITSP